MHQPTRRTLIAAAASLAALPARAHGPTRQKASQTVDIARTPDQVWAIIAPFDAIAQWHPIIASSPADRGNEVGSKRTLTLKAPGDPSFVEELIKYDAAGRSYQYKIDKVDPKVLPVNNYVAWMEVLPNPAGGSTLEWRAAFYRGYMLNDPPADMNDAASVRAVNGVFRAGLDNIKLIAERTT